MFVAETFSCGIYFFVDHVSGKKMLVCLLMRARVCVWARTSSQSLFFGRGKSRQRRKNVRVCACVLSRFSLFSLVCDLWGDFFLRWHLFQMLPIFFLD